jgi:hypothetical protein
MSRALVLLATWLVATAAATALAWIAVREVTADVLPAPATAVVPPSVAPTTGPSEDAAPPAVTQTYGLVGGSVTVRFTGPATELVSHTVAPGFTAEVRAAGPERVEVRWESEDHESRIAVDQEGGAPRVRPEEEDD